MPKHRGQRNCPSRCRRQPCRRAPPACTPCTRAYSAHACCNSCSSWRLPSRCHALARSPALPSRSREGNYVCRRPALGAFLDPAGAPRAAWTVPRPQPGETDHGPLAAAKGAFLGAGWMFHGEREHVSQTMTPQGGVGAKPRPRYQAKGGGGLSELPPATS